MLFLRISLLELIIPKEFLRNFFLKPSERKSFDSIYSKDVGKVINTCNLSGSAFMDHGAAAQNKGMKFREKWCDRRKYGKKFCHNNINL